MKLIDFNLRDTDNFWESALNLIYPIGSIFLSTSDVNPGTLFGGTWTKTGEGKYLLASADSTFETTGGNSTYTLTAANLPKHVHSIPAHNHSLNSHTHTASHAHAMNNHTHDYTKTTAAKNAAHTHTCAFGYYAWWSANVGNDNNMLMGYNSTNSTYSNSTNIGTAKNTACVWNYAQTVSDTANRYRATSTSNSVTPAITVSQTTGQPTGAASGDTGKSAAVTSGGPSKNDTANNGSSDNTGDGGFSNTAISLNPAYYAVYTWKRTA